MQLRPYQLDAITRTLRALHNRPCLVAPTGSGKTVMGVDLVCRLQGSALWIAHRRELIDQAVKALQRLGMHVGVILAGEPVDRFAKIQVASVQTLVRRQIPDNVQLAVVDEAHHATAASYAEVFKLPVPVVGLTATPFRLDGSSLGDLFGELVVAAQVADLVESGHLHAPRVFSHGAPDLSGVKITAGDFNLRQAGDIMDQPSLVGDLVQEWHRLAKGRKTVCFALNVKHSQDIVAAFQAAGVAAEHLDGSTGTDARDAILGRLRSGHTTLVSNCMVLTEGWDLPALECAIIARPTASLNLHLQMVGRIMRACDGKEGAIVLDHAGNHHRHGPVTRRLAYSLSVEPRPVAGESLGLVRCMQCGLMYPVELLICPECGAVRERREREVRVEPGRLQEFDENAYEFRASMWARFESQRINSGYKPYWSVFRYEERFGEKPLVLYPDGECWPGKLVDPSDTSEENKRAVYQYFLDVARSRGFKDGWASHRYKSVFGVWPAGFVTELRQADSVGQLNERWQGAAQEATR